MPAPGCVYLLVLFTLLRSLMRTGDNSLVAYGNKMVNNLFDGTVGFAIDGGIKDSKLVFRSQIIH